MVGQCSPSEIPVHLTVSFTSLLLLTAPAHPSLCMQAADQFASFAGEREALLERVSELDRSDASIRGECTSTTGVHCRSVWCR